LDSTESRPVEPGHRLEQRGLAGAIVSDEPDHLADVNLDVDAVQGAQRRPAGGGGPEPRTQGAIQRRLPAAAGKLLHQSSHGEGEIVRNTRPATVRMPGTDDEPYRLAP